MKLETLIARIEQAEREHDAIREKKARARKDSADWRKLRNRLWTLRRKINGYLDVLWAMQEKQGKTVH